jgi:uncharacterized protein
MAVEENPITTIEPLSAPSRVIEKKFPGIGAAVGLLFLAVFIQFVFSAGILLVNWISKRNLDLNILTSSLSVVIVLYVATFGGVILIGWLLARTPFRELYRFTFFPWKITLWYLPLLAGLVVLLLELMAVVTHILPVSSWLMELMRRLMEESLWLALLFGGLIGPLLEEMLFRGLILRGFLDRYKPWHAILLSALLFGVFHLNVWQFFTAFFLGLLLGWLYWKTGSLWPCFILHALHNSTVTLSGTFIYTTLLGYPEEVVDATVTPYLPIWLTAVGVLFTLAGVCGIRAILKKKDAAL